MAKLRPVEPTRNLQVEHAILHCRLIQYGGYLLDAYCELFPEDLAAHPVDYSTPWTVLAAYDRFCDLVSESMFPCFRYSDCYWVEEGDSHYVEHGLSHVPIAFYGRTWFDKLLDELTPLEKVILSELGMLDGPGVERSKAPAGHMFSERTLEQVCKDQCRMLQSLPEVIAAVIGQTGNVFVDISDDEINQMEPIEWDAPQMRYLAEEYVTAKQIWKLVDRFNKWVDAKPDRLERVQRILLRSFIPEGKRIKVGAKSEPAAGRPLVEVLGGVF